jgi:hypothetical protein
MEAERPVGGIRISREAGTTVRTASYLPTDAAVFCRFLSSRKVRHTRMTPLVKAAMLGHLGWMLPLVTVLLHCGTCR